MNKILIFIVISCVATLTFSLYRLYSIDSPSSIHKNCGIYRFGRIELILTETSVNMNEDRYNQNRFDAHWVDDNTVSYERGLIFIDRDSITITFDESTDRQPNQKLLTPR